MGFDKLFPNITNTLLTLNYNFYLPIYREYALLSGLTSVSRQSCERLLSQGGPDGKGQGRAITIAVGGAQESLLAKPGTMRLVLKERKGFVKLAARCGADLVPSLAFGENELYHQMDLHSRLYVRRLQKLIMKSVGWTMPLFYGSGLFTEVGVLPLRRPINIVIGKPIKVDLNKNIDDRYVNDPHKAYLAGLEKLWDGYKRWSTSHPDNLSLGFLFHGRRRGGRAGMATSIKL